MYSINHKITGKGGDRWFNNNASHKLYATNSDELGRNFTAGDGYTGELLNEKFYKEAVDKGYGLKEFTKQHNKKYIHAYNA